MPSYNQYTGATNYGYRPQTSAVDNANNRMGQQQQQQVRQRTSSSLNANSPAFVPGGGAFNQLSQEERLAEQDLAHFLKVAMENPYGASERATLQFFAKANMESGGALQGAYTEAIRQTMMKAHMGRGSAGYATPATAGPVNSFGATQGRRGSLAEQAQAAHFYGTDEQQPQSAGLGGKFAGRNFSYNGMSNVYASDEQPMTPGRTTVISGGTALGTPAGAGNMSNAVSLGPSKSEAAVSWRRGGNNNSVLSGNRVYARETPSPTVRVTPPPVEQSSPSPTSAGVKARPRPLSLTAQPLPQAVVIDDADDTSSNASSAKSSDEQSSPTTPNSFTSLDAPLSPREEASKKLYEGLGFGRPAPQTHQVVSSTYNTYSIKPASQPIRQPIGPPSNADEFLPKNFATRIRRKAVGGLGVLMGARERRLSVVDAN